MVITLSGRFKPVATDDPVSPLNALWYGTFAEAFALPRLGHLYLLYPLAHTVVSCADTIVNHQHYLFLTHTEKNPTWMVKNLNPTLPDVRLLLLMISPDFVTAMADFIGIPASMHDLLHGTPLLQGDALSGVLQLLVNAIGRPGEVDELYLEVVGQILRLMRLRHQTLFRLSRHRMMTINDLLPRLLRARQFIEARYLEPIRTQDVAAHVALSEYHFARLFKTAFEVTVHQYVMRLRLTKARHLLTLADSSVTDIALTVGYNSRSAFIRAFRNHIDMTPSEYKALFAPVED